MGLRLEVLGFGMGFSGQDRGGGGWGGHLEDRDGAQGWEVLAGGLVGWSWGGGRMELGLGALGFGMGSWQPIGGELVLEVVGGGEGTQQYPPLPKLPRLCCASTSWKRRI